MIKTLLCLVIRQGENTSITDDDFAKVYYTLNEYTPDNALEMIRGIKQYIKDIDSHLVTVSSLENVRYKKEIIEEMGKIESTTKSAAKTQ
jgi:hypothetical protein